VSRPDEVHDPYERLCWLCNPVCLEWREAAQEEASLFRSVAELARKTDRALSRMLGSRVNFREHLLARSHVSRAGARNR
jgi:hypothetical protein